MSSAAANSSVSTMANEPALTPVEGNPFEPKLAPVEHDPFVPQVPESFLHRVSIGLSAGLSRMGELAVEGVQTMGKGAAQIAGQTPREPLPGWVSDLVEARPELKDSNERSWQIVKGAANVLGGFGGVLTSPAGLVSPTIEKEAGIPKEMTELGLGLLGGSKALSEGLQAAKFFRMRDGKAQMIGGLPTTEDFDAAATVLGNPRAAQNLRDLWNEKGIHPAEAAHDAQTDAFLRHDLTNIPEEIKLSSDEEQGLADAFRKPVPLSAAVNDLPDLASIQPPHPPGSLLASIRSAADKLSDIGRDAQMMLAPMATGTTDSMAVAKDFANSMRRNRWDWQRIDKIVEKSFTPEQRKRMWIAGDEESVARQLGESTEHQGLVTLTPQEKFTVEELQSRAQMAWLHARDISMVQGEGLPAYTPRMVINVANAAADQKPISLNAMGLNLRTTTAQLKHRKYMTAEETEAAAKASLGEQVEIVRDIRTLVLATAKLEDAIAGRTFVDWIKEYGRRTGAETVVEGAPPTGSPYKWFTLDHPALKIWRPKFETVDGKVQAATDANGETIFQQVPYYVRGDFEGPSRAVLTQPNGALYNAAMSLKGKTMSLIMNSPIIHNAVEWGRALPAMPGKVASFKVYFEGNRAKNDVATMHEAIGNGLVPIGHRFYNQNIDEIANGANLTPGRSFTAQVLGAVPGLFDPAAGTAVKRAVDKAGDFWHNTLLWDRVADLQMGLYVNFRDDLMAKGVDRISAARAAAHWANRYAGALPQEAMGNGAKKVANLLMFSRSFTLGNLGAMKDMLTGLPKDVLAQIERDAGQINPEAKGYMQSLARRKAMSIVAMDIGLFYVGNSIMQNALNVMLGDSTLDKEMHGYTQRFADTLTKAKEHPLSLLQPFNLMQGLSATNENEPSRQDRVRVGYTHDGTAIYARNPVGRIGEEFEGYLTGPLDMIRRKLGTVARPAWQILANDKGFGRKVYDPDADTPAKYLSNVAKIAETIAAEQFPVTQAGAFMDLVRGKAPDEKLATLQTAGPFFGFMFSKGAPGGPAVGELYQAESQHKYAVDAELPEIRRQIQSGDIEGARARMTELDVPAGLQRFYIRTTQYPATRLKGRTLRDFYRYSTPEQRQRLERALENQPPPQ